MIKEVAGDILLSGARAIAHGVAPNDDFKQGLALALREQWPAMSKDFRHYCHGSHPKPGELWSWKGPESPVIINLMTQDPPAHEGAHPGKAHLESVNKSLRELRKQIDELELTSLAITKVATGVGGLEWKDVKPLIHRHLEDVKIPVYIYAEYKKGVKAKEA
jgi:O-acetyl-ADP-ribose deacetylase (regulator of RNase III)